MIASSDPTIRHRPAAHKPRGRRSLRGRHFAAAAALYERSGPLAHTLAFNDDYIGEKEFQEQALGAIEKVVKKVNKHDELLSDYSRLSPELKDNFEDLTKLKKVANDQQANYDALNRKVSEIRAMISREASASFGDPIKRIVQDEVLSLQFNGIIRRSLKAAVSPAQKEALGFRSKALGEDSSPGSNYIIGELADSIYDVLAEYGIFPTFYVERVGTKTMTVPVDTADPVALAISEGTQFADDANMAGSGSTISLKIVGVLINVYRTLLEDAGYDVTARVLRKFRNAVSYRLDWFCTSANGAANTTDGGFTGIFYGGTAAGAAAGNVSVETLDFDDVVRCLTTVAATVLRRNAKWWMHPYQIARMMLIRDGQGRPIFQSLLERPDLKAMGGILGFPVVLGDACPSANVASSKVAVFGDPDGLYMPMRNDIEIDASDHFKWDYNARSFRGIARAASKVRAATAFAVLTNAAS